MKKKKAYPYEITSAYDLPKGTVILDDDEKNFMRKARKLSKTHTLYTEIDVPGRLKTVYAQGGHFVNRTGRYAYLPNLNKVLSKRKAI